MRFKKDENSNPWMAYTDLGVALVSLFILAFVAMATLKEQKAEDLTRTEEEVLSCQEQMRKIAAERNALLSKSLQTSIEAGLIALELKLCKSVCDKAADEGLNKCGRRRKKQRIAECRKVLVLKENELVDIQRELLGDKHNRYVNEVVSAHKGACDLRIEGEQNDVGNTDQQNQTEDLPCDLSEEVHIQELCLHSLLQGGSFKLNANLVLGAFQNAGCVFLIVIHIILFLPS